jgi:hypothetical protein
MKMFKYIIIIVFTILLFSSCNNTYQNEFKIFEYYDFNTENLVLYGLLSEGESTNFTAKVGDFKISDPSVLNSIKKEWILYPTDNRMPCGYN